MGSWVLASPMSKHTCALDCSSTKHRYLGMQDWCSNGGKEREVGSMLLAEAALGTDLHNTNNEGVVQLLALRRAQWCRTDHSPREAT